MSEEDWEKAIEVYKGGLSPARIAKEILGGVVSSSTVRRGLIKRGVDLRACREPLVTELEWQQSANAYRSGMGYGDISIKILGGKVSRGTVIKGLIERGVEIRLPGHLVLDKHPSL